MSPVKTVQFGDRCDESMRIESYIACVEAGDSPAFCSAFARVGPGVSPVAGRAKHSSLSFTFSNAAEMRSAVAGIRQTRKIITSVDFMSAATTSPFLRRISRAASAVMMEVICWPAIERVTCAISPLVFNSTILPIN